MEPIGRRMERGAALLFARYLAQDASVPEAAVRSGDPTLQEPDAVFGMDIGIEVTQVYYDDEDAHSAADLMRDLDRGIRRTTQIRSVPSSDHTFVERAQSLINRKATRSYAMPTYLVLDARVAALQSAEEGPSLAAQLIVPGEARFMGVFLLLDRNAATGPAGVEFFEVTRPAATI